MSNRNFYYRQLSEAVGGSANFAAVLTADAVALGLVPAQATAFGVVNATLQTCWAASSVPATRTAVAVEATRVAVRAMRAAAVPLAKQIVGNLAVTDAQLVELGLLPRTSPTPIPPTMTAPVVEVEDVDGWLAKLRIRQAGGVESKARPRGSVGALLFSAISPTAPTDPAAYKCEGIASKGITEIMFPNTLPSGSVAWISACWVFARSQRGFASEPVRVTLQGGLMPAGEVA